MLAVGGISTVCQFACGAGVSVWFQESQTECTASMERSRGESMARDLAAIKRRPIGMQSRSSFLGGSTQGGEGTTLKYSASLPRSSVCRQLLSQCQHISTRQWVAFSIHVLVLYYAHQSLQQRLCSCCDPNAHITRHQ